MANRSSITFTHDSSLTLDTGGQFRVGGDGELEVAPGVVEGKAHASTHAALGSDPLTLAQSQVTNLTTDLAGKASLSGATFTGDLGVTSNKSLVMSQMAIYNMTRTIPTTVGNYVELANLTNVNFAANIEIWLNVHSNNFAQSKRYFMPLAYNGTGGTWQKALPISTTGAYVGNDVDLEIRVTNLVASFRLRRSAGTTAGVADLVFILGGSADESTWTESTGTGVASAPTAYYQVRGEGFNAEYLGAGVAAIPFTNRPLAQVGNFPTTSGALSLNSWNGTGVRVPLFVACPTANGGNSPTAAQPALILGREGVNSQAYANFAEFKLRRVSAVGVEARTGLTIALTHGSNAASGTDVLDLRSDGTVAVAGNMTLGGGTALTKAVVYTPSLTPTSVDAADGYVEQYFTVSGLSTSDTIAVNQPVMVAPPHCTMVAFRVSAANTLALTFRTVSGNHLPPQGVYRILAIRS